jgi:hypothetical protein
MPVSIAQKNKVPRNKDLNKGCAFYKENYFLKQEIKGNYRRWRDLPFLWISRISIIKVVKLPKAIYMFNAILIKILMTFLSDGKINPKIHLEAKSMNNQGNTEQKEQCWRYYNTRLQTILQSHSNRNSVVLAQKQIRRPVEQNTTPRYESIQLCLPNF